MSLEGEIRHAWPDEAPRLEGFIGPKAFRANPFVRVIAARDPERLTGMAAWERFDETARLQLRIRRSWLDAPAAAELLQVSLADMRSSGVARCFTRLTQDSLYDELVRAHGFRIQITQESWIVRIAEMRERVDRIAAAMRKRSAAGRFHARGLQAEDWDQIQPLLKERRLYPEQTVQNARDRQACSADMSIVVHEGDRVVGVTLTRVRDQTASVEARAVALEADAHSNLINALMFERFVERALTLELEYLVFSGDNHHHRETLNMARRFGGQLSQAHNRWELTL